MSLAAWYYHKADQGARLAKDAIEPRKRSDFGFRYIGAMSMYVFGIVVAASDETPIGRASATLQVQLPALYPEHRFQFLAARI